MDGKILSVVLLGAGNVAWHFARILQLKNIKIKSVYSRSAKSASSLGKEFNLKYTNTIETIPKDADIYLTAISDDAVEGVIRKINFQPSLIAHTSGSLHLDIFKNKFENFGVIYPLQSFIKNKIVDFTLIPFCVEANSGKNVQILIDFAHLLSNNVQVMSSEKRILVHLAGVFSSNFSNHMYAIACKILNDSSIDYKILLPLLNETAQKINILNPIQAQTGPAVRNNLKVQAMHKKLLEKYPEFKDIYEKLSSSIYRLSTK